MREAWQVDFVDQAGKRRHKQFDKKKDADDWMVKTRNQVREGTYTPESTSKTIHQAADAWIERAKAEGLEQSTITDYKWRRDHALALIDPDTKLARLTQTRCEQLRDDLLKAHSRTTAGKVLQGFKSIMKDAKRRGLIAHNPAAETTIGPGKRHKRRLEFGVDIPTPAEVKALVEAASGKGLALICLAAFAGLSASEIRGLRWTDLDLGSDPTVTIRQRADRWAQIGAPKSATRRRAVELDEITAQALRGWKLAQPPITYRENGEKRQRPATLVFGTGADRPDNPSHLRSRLLGPAMVAAGVTVPTLDDNGNPVKAKDGKAVVRPKYLRMHALRHFAISSWLKTCGGDFKLAQSWAGHATLALTLDLYGHLLPRRDGHQIMRAVASDLFG